MRLPYELLDEIIGYLPLDDRKPLRASSLVAKSWVSLAQRRLFSSVIITNDNHQSWKNSISPTNQELLSHVRSLLYSAALRVPGRDTRLVNDFNYLPSFHRLQSLSLCKIFIPSDIPKWLEVFSAFRHTLSSLILRSLFLSLSTFIAIVDYFPHLRDLEISGPSWKTDHEQAPPLSRPLRGRLSINTHDLKPFADMFSGLETEYDELLILGGYNLRPSARYHQCIVDTCGKCLKRLKLHQRALFAPLTLKHCQGLCHLEFLTTFPMIKEHAVISSITSTNLRTVVFSLDFRCDMSLVLAASDAWKSMDSIMRGLVDKLCMLGYEHTLVLEFRSESVKLVPDLDFRSFMPKFRERGRVKISNTSGGEVFDLV